MADTSSEKLPLSARELLHTMDEGHRILLMEASRLERLQRLLMPPADPTVDRRYVETSLRTAVAELKLAQDYLNWLLCESRMCRLCKVK